MYQRNALLNYLFQQQQMQPPVNMLADASQDFDPNSLVGRLLAQQRAAEAAKAAQAGQRQMPQRPQPQPSGWENGESTLQRRMREQGLNQ